MATVTSRREPDAKHNIAGAIREKAEALLDLELEHYRVAGHLFPKMADLDGQIKELAADLGYSFNEFFEGKGRVKGHGRKDRVSKGKLPEFNPAAFNALTVKEKNELIKRGLVKLEEAWSRADNGEVSIEPLAFAKGHHRVLPAA